MYVIYTQIYELIEHKSCKPFAAAVLSSIKKQISTFAFHFLSQDGLLQALW